MSVCPVPVHVPCYVTTLGSYQPCTPCLHICDPDQHKSFFTHFVLIHAHPERTYRSVTRPKIALVSRLTSEFFEMHELSRKEVVACLYEYCINPITPYVRMLRRVSSIFLGLVFADHIYPIMRHGWAKTHQAWPGQKCSSMRSRNNSLDLGREPNRLACPGKLLICARSSGKARGDRRTKHFRLVGSCKPYLFLF